MRAKREEMYTEMVHLIGQGVSRADAYRKAYNHPEMGVMAAAKNAYKEIKKRKERAKEVVIRERAKAKVEVGEGGEVYTKEELMKILSRMIDGAREDGQPKVAIAAVQTLAKLAGYNEPDKVAVTDDRVEEFVRGQMERAREEGIIQRRAGTQR